MRRLWRWCLRNRTVTVLLGALLLAVVGATWKWREASHLARTEAAARDRLLASVDTYFTQVSESEDLKAFGLEDLRRQLLSKAEQFYLELADDSASDARSRFELARAKLRLASIARQVETTTVAMEHSEGASIRGISRIRAHELIKYGYRSGWPELNASLGTCTGSAADFRRQRPPSTILSKSWSGSCLITRMVPSIGICWRKGQPACWTFIEVAP